MHQSNTLLYSTILYYTRVLVRSPNHESDDARIFWSLKTHTRVRAHLMSEVSSLKPNAMLNHL